MALAAYRHLLRATRIAFNEDVAVLTSAREKSRSFFLTNRSLNPGSPEAIAAITHAEDVAKFLLHNVVQGQKTEDEEKYKLNIHEYTERGDNDTIKMPNGKKVTIDGKTCKD
ncbi:hypothetical protein MFRU_034g00150 [Monilinia fructicola]|uniref:Mitochondrial zinc maintenance protein 1, mitochondrial n=1 Tax=Monilinia fructicola TaxID=38448 RepID=A0A5M9JK90_MONFR|nr:hypothetical protein EYC84_008553 [Monilinia fructicola]KAG4026955.1 hypothetical protein MFRU_034g00150 [Monilinia fructicola]